MEDTSPGVVRDSATIEPWTAPGLGDDTKNGMASRPPQTKGVPGFAYKEILQEGGIQERPEDRLQTEARMLPPSDKRHGPDAQPRPVPLPEDITVSTEEGGTIGAPGAKATLQQQTDVSPPQRQVEPGHVIITSASFYGSLVVLDGRAASVLQFLALDGRQVDGMAPPQPQHPRLTSKEVMTVIVYDVRKDHSAPFHRYQAHSTVSAFDPTN
ncbi:hypothetical protein H257_14649 [Aphanomyces astaci]|uniref:Uncharacterized protein n=1 Tax=Aphanomyces astaci TaxID=112090 RepID=W4FQ74_APHAT|nr:hypothetical protein H257_14649 [Aphanomyces astaci]ETV69627.1 hypothetical protein H257_14649 [Aphanomyces astaci]|eukprot:XP_009840843.1 hypothetical protein H257_14649 [Aphanomyces astaci]